MNKYKILFTTQYLRKYKKITKNNLKLIQLTKAKLHLLAEDPFQNGLNTHKYNQKYSTRVTGDLRIIWQFASEDEIKILNFGGHEGKMGVYK